MLNHAPPQDRIGKDSVLRVSRQTCSQLENKELAVERFAELLRDALRQVPIKKKTLVRIADDEFWGPILGDPCGLGDRRENDSKN